MITKPASDNHISVCICTFKRPHMLSNLLSKLQDQITENLFTYSAVVVDNDANKTAFEIVKHWQNKAAMQIDYFCEPEQNIALARNKAVANAKGNFIAFIDDDEFPDKNWLIDLLKTLNQYQCSGVLGPVKPYFETAPPEWIIKGKICERESYLTGTILKKPDQTRTGNVLLRKDIFDNIEDIFRKQFGSGGEDRDFFRRIIDRGFVFFWCNEAPVYEYVPQERLKISFMIRRALLRGKNPGFTVMNYIVSFMAVPIYTIALPFLLLLGKHTFVKYLIKDFDHIGRLLFILGIDVIKEKYILK